ncbi:hypothetical protein WR25_08961 [Diploscapter pachys]|uniref:Uncharacterized protein n=1 Tax=Diploscapter pachys TaxID=2018661 RepID=A0A2A2JBK1_9BILA|nr:hypothetical protein WR25_08961 [Diploscapter pachys]
MSSEDPPPAVARDKDLEEESAVAAQEAQNAPPVPPRNVNEPQEIKVPTEEELEEIHGHSAEDTVSPLPSHSPPPSSAVSNDSAKNFDTNSTKSISPSGSVRAKKPLPKYTSIDLENELPHIFNTSLNPNLHDPDMTMFFNARGPPYYNYKKTSPPPSYRSSRASFSPPGPSRSKLSHTPYRHKVCFFMFFVVFVVCPLLILLIWELLPDVVIIDSDSPINLTK